MLRLSVFLTLVILCANALPYSKDSGVVILDKKNFAENVFGSEHIWLVEFYAPCKWKIATCNPFNVFY